MTTATLDVPDQTLGLDPDRIALDFTRTTQIRTVGRMSDRSGSRTDPPQVELVRTDDHPAWDTPCSSINISFHLPESELSGTTGAAGDLTVEGDDGTRLEELAAMFTAVVGEAKRLGLLGYLPTGKEVPNA